MERGSLDPEDYVSVDISYRETKEAVDQQIEEVDAIDDKIGVVLGFTGIIFSVLVSMNISTFFILRTPIWSSALFLCSLVLILFSVLFSVLGYRIKDYSAGPNPEEFMKKYIKKDPDWVKAQLTAFYVSAYEENEGIVENKKKWLLFAIYFLFSGLCLSAIRFSYKILMRCI